MNLVPISSRKKNYYYERRSILTRTAEALGCANKFSRKQQQ